MPELIFPREGNNKYSCPYQALLESQQTDYKNTISQFNDRYSTILEQMDRRDAPQDQYDQLSKIKEESLDKPYENKNLPQSGEGNSAAGRGRTRSIT